MNNLSDIYIRSINIPNLDIELLCDREYMQSLGVMYKPGIIIMKCVNYKNGPCSETSAPIVVLYITTDDVAVRFRTIRTLRIFERTFSYISKSWLTLEWREL